MLLFLLSVIAKLHVTVYTSSSQRACNFASLNAADHAQLTAEFAALAVVDGLHFRPIRRRTKSVQVVHFLYSLSSSCGIFCFVFVVVFKCHVDVLKGHLSLRRKKG
jgi:hypothetical protein